MFKKTAALLLCIIMLFALASCTGADVGYDETTAEFELVTDENASGEGTFSEGGQQSEYFFRSESKLENSFKKYGKETLSDSQEEYLANANAVISSPEAKCFEESDGDSVYYIAATGEYVAVSPEGYIRIYYINNDVSVPSSENSANTTEKTTQKPTSKQEDKPTTTQKQTSKQTTRPAATQKPTTKRTTTQKTTTKQQARYVFRNENLYNQHFEKHGAETHSSSKEEYLRKANAVISNPRAMHKIEAEDGDDIYFLESTNEFVVVSTDGYLRTYYICSGINYFNRQ